MMSEILSLFPYGSNSHLFPPRICGSSRADPELFSRAVSLFLKYDGTVSRYRT